jgi:hypothetical protein
MLFHKDTQPYTTKLMGAFLQLLVENVTKYSNNLVSTLDSQLPGDWSKTLNVLYVR